VHFVLVERTRVTTSTPESPGIPARNGFNAYVVLSPVTGLFCHRRQRIKFCLSPVGPTQLRELDASVGASGPHDFAVRCNISRPRAGDRSQVFRPALRSHRAQNAAASTASHPAFVTIMIRPSCGVGWREFVEMICPTSIAKYFCIGDSTRLSTNRPTGKSPRAGESKFRSCPGRGAAFFTIIALDWCSWPDVRHDSDSDQIPLRSEMTRSAVKRHARIKATA
jgi:hypothetical protein